MRGAVRLACIAIGINEAVAAVADRSGLDFFRRGHGVLQAEISANLTLEDAVETATRTGLAAPALVQLMQEALAHSAAQGSRRKHRHGRASLRAGGRQGARAFQQALEAINKQLESALQRSDAECTRCKASEESLLHELDTVRRDVNFYSEEATEARAALLRTQQRSSMLSRKLPGLREARVENEQKCHEDVAAYKKEVEGAKEDLGSISKVFSETACGALFSGVQEQMAPANATTPLLRRHIVAHRRKRRRAVALASIRSDATRRQLADLIRDLDGRSNPQQQQQQQRQGVHTAPRSRSPNHPNPSCGHSGCAGRFRLRSSPDCDYARDRMLRMQAEAKQKLQDLESGFAEAQEGCMDEGADVTHEIEELVAQGRWERAELAHEIAEETDRHTIWEQRSQEMVKLQKEYDSETKICNDNIAQLQSEICAMRKIRGQLAKMEGGGNTYFQDCEVSEWSAGECSVPCGGGGTRHLTRSVITPPARGAACPPLKMVQECGTEACPIDCEATSWSSWSSCSAQCGGGIRERIRRVVRRAEHGGRPCGAVTEAQECNAQACNTDCRLAKWTEWSACSATCGRGSQQRIRRVRKLAAGGGYCPEAHDHRRLNFKMCEVAACPVQANQPTSTCGAKVDLFLLLDGSSAVSSADWALLRQAASMTVKALVGDGSKDDGPRVAVLVFGGKLTNKCAAAKAESTGDTQPMTLADCGITWLNHIDTKTEASLEATVSGYQYPGGTAVTHTALEAAGMEAIYGREGASSVLAVLTAGEPLNAHLAGEASRHVQEEGVRVMWVPVLRSGLQAARWEPMQEMKHWVSLPLQENLVVVEGFNTMATASVVSRLVDEICVAPQEF